MTIIFAIVVVGGLIVVPALHQWISNMPSKHDPGKSKGYARWERKCEEKGNKLADKLEAEKARKYLA